MERAEAEAILDGDRETALALPMRIDELIAANRRLESRVAELEERLKRNSRHSSLPPSAGPPSAPPRPRQAASGRRARARPGPPGHGRPLPRTAGLRGAPSLQRRRCPQRGAVTRAALPAGAPPGAFGPRLQAAVATLAVRNRVSRRDTTELLRELFGARLSAGSVAAILQRVARALDEPYEDLLGHVRAAPAVNVDETGWRLRGGRRTLQGGAHLSRRGLSHRCRSPPPRGAGAARRGALRRRLLGPLGPSRRRRR